MKAYHHQHRRGCHLPAYCVCSHCGAAIRHVPGVPCTSRTCPVCGNATYKSYEEVAAEKLVTLEVEEEEDFEPAKQKREVQFPVVNPEKCTACGQCISVCPADCISFVNGKAFVQEVECRNCRICVRVCPENAFEIK
jgi:ferredoxin